MKKSHKKTQTTEKMSQSSEKNHRLVKKSVKKVTNQ